VLVAYRLAGLSALGAHYAGLNALAQFGPCRAAISLKGPGWAPTDGRPRRGLPGPGAARLRRLSAKRTCHLSNFAPDTLGWLAWAMGQPGNGADFSLSSSLPVCCTENAVFLGHLPVRQAQRVCTQSRPIFSLSDGVMLGTAWIDRPVETQGCAPASTSSLRPSIALVSLGIERHPPVVPPL
jgi:hypothetical protein